MKNVRIASVLAVAVAAGCSSTSETDDSTSTESALASNVNVVTQHNDNDRSGANLSEQTLTTQNVTAAKFGKLFERAVDGQIYAQPLYVGGVNGKNVVYVATEHNSVYAFDADSATAAAPLWKVSLGPAMPAQDTGGCQDLTPEIGITATPTIDLASKTIYVSAKTKEAGGPGPHHFYKLHALDLATGQPKRPAVVVNPSFAGHGAGNAGGTLHFDARLQLNRPGLLMAQGKIWLAFGGQCDINPYHGWVVAYDAATLAPAGTWVNTPDGERGGIWQGGVGLSADSAGGVYAASGNGSFDGQKNLGGGITRLTSQNGGIAVTSFFSPGNIQSLNQQDLDVGGTGPLLIPGTQLLVTGGKQGFFYVVDREHMGGSSPNDGQIVQKIKLTNAEAWGGPAFWQRARGSRMYVWGKDDHLKSFGFNGATFDATPVVNGSTPTRGARGGQVSLSANGEQAGTGIVWATHPNDTTGFVAAYDADDITHQLWRSDARPSDTLGAHAKFAAPTIAHGRVYVPTFSNKLVVYGLLTGPPPDAGAEHDAGDGGAVHDATANTADAHVPAPTWTTLYNDFFGHGTPGHCGNCHAGFVGGFKCGTTKGDCYAGLVASGLVNPSAPATSRLGDPQSSPLSWFGGGMPADQAVSNPAAAAAVTAWLAAGAKND